MSGAPGFARVCLGGGTAGGIHDGESGSSKPAVGSLPTDVGCFILYTKTTSTVFLVAADAFSCADAIGRHSSSL